MKPRRSFDKKLRESGTVASAVYETEDHGILTCWLGIDFGGSYQGFGGLCLDALTGPDFKAEILKLFEVPRLEDVVGRRVVALRCFEAMHSPIEGLEVGGRRFVVTAWRRKHWPEVKSPLAQAQESLDARIVSLRRQLAEAESEVEELSSLYHPVRPCRSDKGEQS